MYNTGAANSVAHFYMTGVENMRLAAIVSESLADGPGIRMVIFVQGCPHKCPECHNPDTWNPDGGYEMPISKLLRKIKTTRKKYHGITFSGGEPFLQAADVAKLAEAAKKRGWDVVVSTGYLYEDLIKNPDSSVQSLLSIADILVDGPYVHSLQDTSLPFRGSSNQRVIDLKATRTNGEIIMQELEQSQGDGI